MRDYSESFREYIENKKFPTAIIGLIEEVYKHAYEAAETDRLKYRWLEQNQK